MRNGITLQKKDLDAKIADVEKTKKDSEIEIAKFKSDLSKVTTENSNLKAKLDKLKNRKNLDANQKFCINCQKDYLEKENYNWSCQLHRSDYGGEMWWCCGKKDSNAVGCKS
jgi:uncharacterized protein YfcZ (UPF0381/DUF406 family)